MGTESYYVRRIFSKEELNVILNANLNANNGWFQRYPYHEQWISSVISKLKDDQYERLAFGLFAFYSDEPQKEHLLFSALVKSKQAAPHLELKNLLLHTENKIMDSEETKSKQSFLFDKLLKHIVRFAESRQYEKIYTDVINHDIYENSILRELLIAGFEYSGSNSNKYAGPSQINTLSMPIRSTYSYDPYDYDRASYWIIEKFFIKKRYSPKLTNESFKHKDTNITVQYSYLQDNEEHYDKLDLHVHTIEVSEGSGDISSKLKTKMNYLTIPRYLNKTKKIHKIESIEFTSRVYGDLCIFDFSIENEDAETLKDSSSRPLKVWERDLKICFLKAEEFSGEVIYFNNHHVNALLYADDEALTDNRNKTAEELGVEYYRNLSRFDSRQIAGLVTLAPPSRVKYDRINSLFNEGKVAAYIKFGSKGQLITQSQKIIFYEPKRDDDAVLWGIASVYGKFEMTPSIKQQYRSSNAASDKVWEEINDNIREMFSIPFGFVWAGGKEEFVKHNRFNPSNELIIYLVYNFVDLSPYSVSLSDIVKNKEEYMTNADPGVQRRKSMLKEVDAYVGETELLLLDEKLVTGVHNDLYKQPVLSFSETSIYQTFDNLKVAMASVTQEDESPLFLGEQSAALKILNQSDNVEKPVFNLIEPTIKDFEKEISEYAPDILIFSAHMFEEEPFIVKPMKRDSLDYNPSWFQSCLLNNSSIHLLLLCCCFSGKLASKLSKNRFVIAFSKEADENDCEEATKILCHIVDQGYSQLTLPYALRNAFKDFNQTVLNGKDNALGIWVNKNEIDLKAEGKIEF